MSLLTLLYYFRGLSRRLPRPALHSKYVQQQRAILRTSRFSQPSKARWRQRDGNDAEGPPVCGPWLPTQASGMPRLERALKSKLPLRSSSSFDCAPAARAHSPTALDTSLTFCHGYPTPPIPLHDSTPTGKNRPFFALLFRLQLRRSRSSQPSNKRLASCIPLSWADELLVQMSKT